MASCLRRRVEAVGGGLHLQWSRCHLRRAVGAGLLDAVAAAAAAGCELRSVDLSRNGLTDAEAGPLAALVKALDGAASLIDVRGNQLSLAAAAEVAEAGSRCRVLTAGCGGSSPRGSLSAASGVPRWWTVGGSSPAPSCAWTPPERSLAGSPASTVAELPLWHAVAAGCADRHVRGGRELLAHLRRRVDVDRNAEGGLEVYLRWAGCRLRKPLPVLLAAVAEAGAATGVVFADLSGNGVADRDTEQLCAVIAAAAPPLRGLILGGAQLSEEAADRIVAAGRARGCTVRLDAAPRRSPLLTPQSGPRRSPTEPRPQRADPDERVPSPVLLGPVQPVDLRQATQSGPRQALRQALQQAAAARDEPGPAAVHDEPGPAAVQDPGLNRGRPGAQAPGSE
eukprot:TRINITY_DN5111_c0_g3_i3.p1 TRINITY_DN5111_c0_g3~~TRINITY_DN5111_c0_g3_i3.p1  ORF type:complete len:395 (+),score=148.68 TRINITY_DN5111_c0_g3_i3:966-2150(+)